MVGFAVALVAVLEVVLVVVRKDESVGETVGETVDEVKASPAAEMMGRRMFRFLWTGPPRSRSPNFLPKPHLQIAE